MSDSWLPTLTTETPEAGFQLAIKMARVGVKMTQPSDEVRTRLRPEYAENPDSLIASSQVIAINFQTVAAANGYWRAS
ncbi:hexameric tyrosine-coordinated heme protein [Kribbella endophytica]